MKSFGLNMSLDMSIKRVPFRMPFIRPYQILLIGYFIISSGNILYAQEPSKDTTPQILLDMEQDSNDGKIKINQQSQITGLLKMHITNNRVQNGIPGYRIRIFSQSGLPARSNANNTRTEFMKNFPEIEAYMVYNEPNFQILVGDFRTKTEALKEYKRIIRSFPNAFIISETIKIPK